MTPEMFADGVRLIVIAIGALVLWAIADYLWRNRNY